jgi:LAO/AO transport system kinase
LPESNRRGRLTAPDYLDGIVGGDRVLLARAITVIESDLLADRDLAEEILQAILPHAGKSYRTGITGVPGAGKSTFIDALGMHLVRVLNQKVAVLSVDPSSPVSGGSILGDKTRMSRLSKEDRAFIRPSPARGYLGGVGRHTRESIMLCEAAGYDNILVETVGVGQSETAVRSMTDFFLLLIVPGAGDELQGMKRGIVEMLDGIAVNKADGDNKARAERARADYSAALHLLPQSSDGWIPRVLTCSALTGENIPAIWQMVRDHQAQSDLRARRTRQSIDWMNELVLQGLEEMFRRDPAISERLPQLTEAVRLGTKTPVAAARELLSAFHKIQPLR